MSLSITTPRHIIGSFVVFLASSGITASAGDVAATRAAVERSLPYLMEQGNWWIEKKDCVSCHRVSFQVWAHAEALVRGFDVDQQELSELTEWSLQALAKEDDDGVATALKNPDGAAQLLAAIKPMSRRKQPSADTTSLVEWIARKQNEDGSWKPAGQLPSQKRPVSETTAVSTMWNIILAAEAGISDDAITRAAAYLKEAAEGESTEWLVTRAMFLGRFGETTQLQPIIEKLCDEQNADGGWGWIRSQESDAIATGQVLWALHRLGQQVNTAENIGRGVDWLLKTQKDNGSWPTKGTKKNRKDKIAETATYWGSAWATIGLLQTLPLTTSAVAQE